MNRNKANLTRVLECILEQGQISKNDIARSLELSVPTVLNIVKKCTDEGIVCESGIESSGLGRKARLLSLNPTWRYAVGIDLTKNHISLVLLNMRKQVIAHKRMRKAFSDQESYCCDLCTETERFLEQNGVDRQKVLGIGISMPGIIDREAKLLVRSHILGVKNLRLDPYVRNLPYPLFFENDANAALMAEMLPGASMVYLSLSNSVGGAFCVDGQILAGNGRAGEFGHITLHPGGRKCYCGCSGCADAYLSAARLSIRKEERLEDFFDKVKAGEKEYWDKWDAYLTDLAILVRNLRVAADMDIVIGGYVGYYLKPYMDLLEKKLSQTMLFDTSVDYLHPSIHLQEVSAVGAAGYFIHRYLENCTL